MARYSRPLKWYGPAYGLPDHYVSKCYTRKWPLDNPERLLETILAINKGVRPDTSALQALVEEQRAKRGHKKTSPGVPFKPPKTPKLPPPPPPPDDEDLPPPAEEIDYSKLEPGVAQELKRMQTECMLAYKDYKKQVRPLDKLAMHKVWVALVKSMRELAKDAPTAEREARTVVAVVDVEATWVRAFQEARMTLENLPRRISTNMLFAAFRDRGLDPVDIEQVVRAECDKVVQFLEKGSWLEKKD